MRQKIDYDLSVLAGRTQTGMDWEIIVQIAILLRCIGHPQGVVDVPFLGRCVVLEISCETIPVEYTTLADVHVFISNGVNSLAVGTILYLTPQYAKFPDYDLFLVYKATNRLTRVKLIRGYPKHPVPTWIEKAFLIRGNAPERPHLKDEWIYLNKDEMMSLLGVSMAPLYPHTWPNLPQVDDFL